MQYFGYEVSHEDLKEIYFLAPFNAIFKGGVITAIQISDTGLNVKLTLSI